MAIQTLFDRLRSKLRTFRTAKGGNVVITFALATIPIVGFVGAAVDYSRGNSAKAAMQAAVDSTALMLSKDAQTLTTSQLNQKANSYFQALFNRTDVSNIAITPVLSTPTQGSFRLDVAGTGTVATTFTKVLGQQNLNINVTLGGAVGHEEARAGAGARQYRLDGLVEQDDRAQEGRAWLARHVEDGRQVARRRQGRHHPFDTTVNIGTSYKNEPWFDIDSIDCNGWKSGSGCNSTNWKSYWEGCVRDRTYPYDAQDDRAGLRQNGTLYPVLRLRRARARCCRSPATGPRSTTRSTR